MQKDGSRVTYNQWLDYNIKAEEHLLKRTKVEFGEISEQYRKKYKQLKDLKDEKSNHNIS